jgi:FkbM family methyltransferase
MQFSAPAVRPPSLFRQLAKAAWFVTRGSGPAHAWWLAKHDALKNQDYRGVSLQALAAAYRADPSWVDLIAANGRICSRTLNLEFQTDDQVSRGYLIWIALAKLGWRFSRLPSANLLAQRESLSIHVTTDEERDMITEIFLAGCYDLRLPGTWQVVDVGANVGMAALFFASQPWVQRVVSFEPFAPTADAFEANVRLNPHLAPKISLVRKGLDETDKNLTVDYHRNLRGSMSLAGLGAWRGSPAASAEKVAIDVRRASAELAPILASLSEGRLLGKVDCEGSEYGIFRDLEASGAIGKFSAFVVEWHGAGPDEIAALLQRNHFAVQVLPTSPDQRTLGLIYAVRLSS